MKVSRQSRIFLLALLLGAKSPLNLPAPRPAGIILEAGTNARLISGRNNESARGTQAGDIVFPGDKLFLGGQLLRYLHLGTEGAQAVVYTYAPEYVIRIVNPETGRVDREDTNFDIRIEQAQPLLKNARISEQKYFEGPVAFPGRSGPLSTLYRLQLAQALSAADPGSTRGALLHMTAASADEREGKFESAAAHYQAVAKVWPGAGWLRRKMPEIAGYVQADRTRLAQARQRSWAVLVGVREYEGYAQLANADRDANLFRSYLTDPKGGGLAADHVVTLSNTQASTAAIRNTLADILLRRAGERDSVYIFFSCYGAIESGTEAVRAYILGTDSRISEKQAAAYAVEDLGQAIRAAAPRLERVLVVASLGEMRPQPKGLMTAAWKQQLSLAAGRLDAIVATHPKTPPVPDGVNAFSRFLVSGLKGSADADGNGRVTVQELYTYLSRQVQAQGKGDIALVTEGDAASRDDRIAAVEPGRTLLASLQRALGLALQVQVPAAEPVSSEDEEAGQRVMRQYLDGYERPPTEDDFGMAASAFRRAERARPSAYLSARALFCEGRLATMRGRHAEALPLLLAAIDADPDGAYSYNALGIAYLSSARYLEAAHAFRDAMRKAPEWIYPMHNLALTYAEAGAYDAAIAQYREAIHKRPEYGTLHHNLGALYQKLKLYADAERQYRIAQRFENARIESSTGLGTLYASRNRLQDAADAYEASLKAGPSRIAAHDLGILYLDWNRTNEAIETFEKNRAAYPSFVPTQIELTRAYIRAGRLDQAATLMADLPINAAQSAPVRGFAAEIAGEQAQRTGKWEEATRQYQAALTLSSEDTDRKRLRRKVNSAGTKKKS